MSDEVVLAHGRYVLHEAIGKGGMATVYRATDTHLGALRAIKVLDQKWNENAESRARFALEARLLTQLQHPNIVRVHDVLDEPGEAGWWTCLVMDYMEGGSISRRMRRTGPLSVDEAVSVLDRVLLALQTAHARGIIHRDVKPSNILLSGEGEPCLVDFGIAIVLGRTEDLTGTGMVVGTWPYLSPELRISSHEASPASDIYSAGCTLFNLVTAREPFDLYVPSLCPTQFEGLPEPLLAVLHKATHIKSRQRYPSALAFRDALQQLRLQLPDLGPLPLRLQRSETDTTAQGVPRLPDPLDPRESEAASGQLVFVFPSSLATGDPVIDGHHRKILEWGYKLLRERELAETPSDFEQGLRFLEEYVVYHFKAEEDAMRRTRYARAAEHRQAHQVMRQKVESLVQHVSRRGLDAEVRSQLRILLSNWLTHHIYTMDRNLADWLVLNNTAVAGEIPVSRGGGTTLVGRISRWFRGERD